jgi:glutathione peroxidase
LWEEYGGKGFEILAFPCNQFNKQEPGTNAEIKEYAKKCMKAKFPMFSKICTNGDKACEIYKYLRRNSRLYNEERSLTRQVPWNFTKFLVCADGKTIVYFNPRTPPRDIVPFIIKNLDSEATIMPPPENNFSDYMAAGSQFS